jgi:hypothetical protein
VHAVIYKGMVLRSIGADVEICDQGWMSYGMASGKDDQLRGICGSLQALEVIEGRNESQI